MQTLSVKVARKILEADDIVSFELRPVDDVQLPPFSAGSHVDVQLRSGLVRQYSLCNHSDETHRYMIGVLRDPHSRGGSTAMHELQEGDVMQISQPRNHFPLVPAPRSVLFADRLHRKRPARMLPAGDALEEIPAVEIGALPRHGGGFGIAEGRHALVAVEVVLDPEPLTG